MEYEHRSKCQSGCQALVICFFAFSTLAAEKIKESKPDMQSVVYFSRNCRAENLGVPFFSFYRRFSAFCNEKYFPREWPGSKLDT
jgi:hypothetical protein